jgi:hypothetical protein
MATFLRDRKVLEADVIAIQEPWANGKTETTHQPASHTHQLLYPKQTDFGEERVGVCLLISKDLDPNKWTHRVITKDYQIWKITYKRQTERGRWGRGMERAANETD